MALNKWREYKFNIWVGSAKLQENPGESSITWWRRQREPKVDRTGKGMAVWMKMEALLFVGEVGKDGIRSMNIFQAHIPFRWTCVEKILCTYHSLVWNPSFSSECHGRASATDLAGPHDFPSQACRCCDEYGRQSGRNTQKQIYFLVTFISFWLINIDTTDKTQHEKTEKHLLSPKRRDGMERNWAKGWKYLSGSSCNAANLFPTDNKMLLK